MSYKKSRKVRVKKSSVRRKRRSRSRSNKLHKRRFGSKDSLLNMMGNFRPSSEMSYAQSTTGMSASQMRNHMAGISPSLADNFYTYT
jgi:hypothetical protein